MRLRTWGARAGWILALALVLRVLLILQMGNRYYFADTMEYENAARGILAGNGPGADYPRAPLYPVLMAIAFKIGGEGNFIAARLLQLAYGLGVVALMMRLARQIGLGERAWLAGLAGALAPTLVFTTSMLYPTALYTFLLLALTTMALALDADPHPARAALAGVLVMLLWLTDQVAIAPIAGVLVWLLFGLRRGGWRLAGAIALAAAVAVTCALPWTAWQEHAYGRSKVFMAKPQYVLFMVRHHSDIAGVREVRDTTSVFKAHSAAGFLRQELGLARRQPLAYLDDYALEFVHFFRPMPDRVQTQNQYTRRELKLVAAVYFVPVLVLFLFGALLGPASWRHRLLLVTLPLATDAAYAFFFTQTRYRVPIEPQMLVLAVLGALVLWPGLGGGAPRRAPVAAPPELVAAHE